MLIFRFCTRLRSELSQALRGQGAKQLHVRAIGSGRRQAEAGAQSERPAGRLGFQLVVAGRRRRYQQSGKDHEHV